MRDLSLHLMDIIQNSISAKATKIVVKIIADEKLDKLTIGVKDNGEGMEEAFLKSVTDPFKTTRDTRKIGLGISLFMASAQRAGGDLIINSVLGIGTDLEAAFKTSHIDRLPLGDISETIIVAILTKPEIEFELEISSSKKVLIFNTSEVKDRIGIVPITELEILTWIKDYINEGIKITFGGVLDEIHC